MDSKLKDYLGHIGVEYVEYKHNAVFNVEESKELKEKIPGMHCKCLFLKDNLGKFYLIGMKADKRLDIKKLEKYFGVKKIRFGTEEELSAVLRLKPGSVSIFGIANLKDGESLMLIFDKEILTSDFAGFHPNVNTSTLVLSRENLKKFYNSLNCEKEILELQ